MQRSTSFIRTLRAALVAFVLALVAAPAFALDKPGPLPTAPGASKAIVGGPTAEASLPGDGGSPLEPYLYLVILAGGGLLSGVAMSVIDRQTRARRRHA